MLATSGLRMCSPFRCRVGRSSRPCPTASGGVRMRATSAAALLALLLSIAAATMAADCLITWRVPGAVPDGAGVRVRCRDGDPPCDADGAADGACTFAAVLCLNAEGCEPGRLERVRVVGRRGRRVAQAAAALAYPVEAPTCTGPAPVRLRARRH